MSDTNFPLSLEVGRSYFFRTITFHYTGRIRGISENAITLCDAAWIADSGRFTNALTSGRFAEVEPYPDDMPVAIMFSAIIDFVPWTHPLPREQM
jgi:hypothetical protein